MLEFYEKRRLKKWLHSKPFLLFMVLPIGFMAYAAYNAYEVERATNDRRIELLADLNRLEGRTAILERDIARLEDPRDIEAALRQRYQVGREGEEVIILVEEEPAITETPLLLEEERPTGFFGKLRSFLGF
jgi:cell division protein FtsB